MPPKHIPERNAVWRWAPIAVMVAAVAAAYANALGAGFQFDDWNVIVDEPRVQSLAAWWASMPAIRPLLKLSYACNNSLGFGPAGFHLINIAIHATNSVLAFLLLTRLALREDVGSQEGVDGRAAQALAFFGALLFTLHPVQTEAVTYVSGRSTSLAALFSLASVLAWIDGRARGRTWLIGLSAALFAAGLLVKETSAVVPLALLLWECGNLQAAGRFFSRAPWLHLLVLGLAAVIAISSSTYRHLFNTSFQARSVGVNLLTQVDATIYLLGQLVRFDRLNADPALAVVNGWTATLAVEAAALLLLLVLGAILVRRLPAVSFGILWFFLWLAPTNSFIPRLDVVNDRQLYLAILGPAWIVVWLLWKRLPTLRGPRLALAIILVLSLGVATYHRNQAYANEIVFWEDVTRKAPHNGRAFNNLGYAYALAARRDDAEIAFRHALTLDPGDVRAAVNLRLLLEGGLTVRPGPP
jgi:tetratricopeptide (TPR) repeat protein